MEHTRKIVVDDSGFVLNWFTLNSLFIVPDDGIDITEEQYEFAVNVGATHYIDGQFFRDTSNLTSKELHDSFKAERAMLVGSITVEVDGMLLDGDEISQDRMSRSLIAMNDDELQTWILHDNTVVQLTKTQLRQALRLAGLQQTSMWVPKA